MRGPRTRSGVPNKKGPVVIAPAPDKFSRLEEEHPLPLMGGLSLHGSLLQLLNVQANPQIQFVDRPLRDFRHPDQILS